MFLIVGLGNPEKKYDLTYHNVGFLTIDKLAEELDVKFSKTYCKASVAEAFINGQKVLLAKPKTYMNLSGASVQSFKNKFKLKNTEILVIVDDIDLPKGTYRYRESGSAGTHNGMRSIVQNVGPDFKRLRIGIKPEEKPFDLADYVLSKIDKDSFLLLDKVTDEVIDFIFEKVLNVNWFFKFIKFVRA